jgi:hypothetical protein
MARVNNHLELLHRLNLLLAHAFHVYRPCYMFSSSSRSTPVTITARYDAAWRLQRHRDEQYKHRLRYVGDYMESCDFLRREHYARFRRISK